MGKLGRTLSAVIVITVGTLMHFAHNLPSFNHFWGYVFPVNECVWEHMKMVVWPLWTAVTLFLIWGLGFLTYHPLDMFLFRVS